MAGVDINNQYPNSYMALAAKNGTSRFRSVDTPAQPIGPSQINTSISTVGGTALTVPSLPAGTIRPVSYAIITASGGALYATYDGSAPSATNYDITIPSGGQLPVQGANALAAIKVFGTTMSVSYWT